MCPILGTMTSPTKIQLEIRSIVRNEGKKWKEQTPSIYIKTESWNQCWKVLWTLEEMAEHVLSIMKISTTNSLYFIRCSGYNIPGVCCSARLQEWDSTSFHRNIGRFYQIIVTTQNLENNVAIYLSVSAIKQDTTKPNQINKPIKHQIRIK